MTPIKDDIKIIPYRNRYASDFSRLNREWLEGFDLLEAADTKHLDFPRESIIDKGGQVFIAVSNDEVLGTCAAIRQGREVVEVAKLAVVQSAQQRGIGRLLVQTVIDHARRMGAKKISLVSSTRLVSALRLYASMGFVSKPLPMNPGYASADVYMERVL